MVRVIENERQEYTLDMPIHRTIHRQFGVSAWGNPRGHWENMQTPHIKDSNLGPFLRWGNSAIHCTTMLPYTSAISGLLVYRLLYAYNAGLCCGCFQLHSKYLISQIISIEFKIVKIYTAVYLMTSNVQLSARALQLFSFKLLFSTFWNHILPSCTILNCCAYCHC